jgi:hypothetical protein
MLGQGLQTGGGIWRFTDDRLFLRRAFALSCGGQMASSGYDWQHRMDRETELQIIRSAYATRVMFAAGIRDRRVETAFAAVPRERFLGRGPWPILRWNRGYVPTPSRNPVYIYDDVLIGIVPERRHRRRRPGPGTCPGRVSLTTGTRGGKRRELPSLGLYPKSRKWRCGMLSLARATRAF